MNPTVIDLFAGVGGLSLGFEQAGFQVVLANEYDAEIAAAYKKNHHETKMVVGDITALNLEDTFGSFAGKIDVIIGGPPCQGFSYAGWRDPNDQRNQLFKEFVALVDKIQPKFFVMENVLGILTMRNGDAIKEIIQAFSEIGYYVNDPLKLNAVNFGVPQRRKRVFIIGSRSIVNIEQPKPLFTDEDDNLPGFVTVQDAIGSLPVVEDGGGAIEMEATFENPSPYDRLMSKEISFEEFYEESKKMGL